MPTPNYTILNLFFPKTKSSKHLPGGIKNRESWRFLGGGAEARQGNSLVQLVADDPAVRVDLAHLPVGVLVVGLVAVEVQLGLALGPEAAALGARPRLVDGELARRPREAKRALVGRLAGRVGAVVVDETVVKVAEPSRNRRALIVVADGLVGQRKVDVAPRVLVRGRGKGPARMEIKVLDLELGHLGRVRGADIVGSDGGSSHGRGGKEGSSEAVHDGCVWCWWWWRLRGIV